MLAMLAVSCTLDNYDMPDASLSGRFLDVLTNEPLQCDIYNGTTIQYVEDGYKEMQTNVVKADGSYSIGQMFSGKYALLFSDGLQKKEIKEIVYTACYDAEKYGFYLGAQFMARLMAELKQMMKK